MPQFIQAAVIYVTVRMTYIRLQNCSLLVHLICEFSCLVVYFV